MARTDASGDDAAVSLAPTLSETTDAMPFLDPAVLTEHLQFRIVLDGTAFVIAFAAPPRGMTTPGVAHWVVIDEAGERCTCFEAPITSHLPTLEARARSVLRAMLAPRCRRHAEARQLAARERLATAWQRGLR